MMTTDLFLLAYMPAAWILSGLFACAVTLVPIALKRQREEHLLFAWCVTWMGLMLLALLYYVLTINLEGIIAVLISIPLQLLAFLPLAGLVIAITRPDPQEYAEWASIQPAGFVQTQVRSAIRSSVHASRHR